VERLLQGPEEVGRPQPAPCLTPRGSIIVALARTRHVPTAGKDEVVASARGGSGTTSLRAFMRCRAIRRQESCACSKPTQGT
jgi:hypothetical protein